MESDAEIPSQTEHSQEINDDLFSTPLVKHLKKDKMQGALTYSANHIPKRKPKRRLKIKKGKK
jgi:hypothetical protein